MCILIFLITVLSQVSNSQVAPDETLKAKSLKASSVKTVVAAIRPFTDQSIREDRFKRCAQGYNGSGLKQKVLVLLKTGVEN